MGLILVTPPTIEPISTPEAMDHLRVDGADEYALINGLVKKARGWCENYCHRAFLTQTWRYTLDDLPINDGDYGGGTVRLPRPRLIAVTAFQYVDTTGTTQTLSSANYQVDADSEPARIIPVYGAIWPTYRKQLAALRITYTAGYGSTMSTVPEEITQAMLLLIGYWFENREPTPLELSAIESLLSPFRVMEYA